MAFRAVSSASAAAASVAIATPTGTLDNDIMLAFVGSVVGAAITAPAGWAQIETELVSGSVRVAYFWKRAASEGASHTFTSTGATNTIGKIASYSGRITSGSPFDGTFAAGPDAGGTSHTATGFTTTVDGCDLITSFGSMSVACTWTPPAGETERSDVNSSNISDEVQTTAGATGDKTATSSASVAGSRFFVALKPEPAAAPSLTPSTLMLLTGVGY